LTQIFEHLACNRTASRADHVTN